MEGLFAKRVVEAAKAQGDDPGWSLTMMPDGVQIKYTWQHVSYHPFTNRPMFGNTYTVESFIPWDVAMGAPNETNPLLVAMKKLLVEQETFRP